MEKNAIVFGADLSSSAHIDKKRKDILIPGEGATLNFTQSGQKFVLSLHYNESNSFLLVNATKIYQFKAKDSEIKKMSLVFRKYFRRFFG